MKIDENEVRKTLAIMKPQNTLFEIRIISSGGGSVSGYFQDVNLCVGALKKSAWTGMAMCISR